MQHSSKGLQGMICIRYDKHKIIFWLEQQNLIGKTILWSWKQLSPSLVWLARNQPWINILSYSFIISKPGSLFPKCCLSPYFQGLPDRSICLHYSIGLKHEWGSNKSWHYPMVYYKDFFGHLIKSGLSNLHHMILGCIGFAGLRSFYNIQTVSPWYQGKASGIIVPLIIINQPKKYI